MALWCVMALMTGAAVMAVLWPLSRRGASLGPVEQDDLGFYRDQLLEIDREADRGLIAPAEAEAAKAEAGRRLLRAKGPARPLATTGEPALRRRRAAAALGLSVVPLVGLAVYGALGSPGLATRPSLDLAAGGSRTEIGALIAKVETHLAANPNDARGWDVIAPVYLRVGRFEDAARAFSAARRLAGDNPDRAAGYGEALVGAAGGVVSREATTAFEEAVKLDPGSARPRFYLAMAAEQDGKSDLARAEYERLVRSAPPQAPWLPVVEARLARFGGAPSGTQQQAAPARPEVAPEIRAMVDGLDARLRQGGGNADEWLRLVRSYAVLGERDAAADRLNQARLALAADGPATARLDGLAQELGLGQRGTSP
ncbi:MAG: cytochrome biosis protein CcmI [Enterovirga sp.]|nr:cytochrome biosis protein CcmI [Enterovirga sp.]